MRIRAGLLTLALLTLCDFTAPSSSAAEWTPAADWDPLRGPEHMDHLTIRRARLAEVSLTPTPAFPSAQVLEVMGDAIAASARPNLRAAAFAIAQRDALASADAAATRAPALRAGSRELGSTTAAWHAWLAVHGPASTAT